jgi:hypothetical protein
MKVKHHVDAGKRIVRGKIYCQGIRVSRFVGGARKGIGVVSRAARPKEVTSGDKSNTDTKKNPIIPGDMRKGRATPRLWLR